MQSSTLNNSSMVKKGATKHCAYGICNSDSRYADRSPMKDVFFLRFPQSKKDEEKCRRWANACCRQGFDENSVKKDTYICSLHFVGGKGPTNDFPDPIPATATKYDVQRLSKRPRRKAHRRLVLTPNRENQQVAKLVLPVADNKAQTPLQEDVAEILLSLRDPVEGIICFDEKENDVVHIETTQEEKRQCFEHDTPKVQDKTSVHCQTDPNTHEIGLRITNKILENDNKVLKSKIEVLEMGNYEIETNISSKEQEKKKVLFDVDDVKTDNKKCKFYTGLTWLQFSQLWQFLNPAVNHLRYWNRSNRDSVDTSKYKISPQNALLMTLIRLRQGLPTQDIAYRFGVSASTVSNIILTWIQFLYTQFLPLKKVMFANKNHIRGQLPHAFKKYKNIRCIIDCTEFFVQRPSNFERQGNLYSSYKAHTTYKVLIGVAPNGAVMFVSDVYEGSVSDRDIVVKSGFLDHLEPGDTIMADRGFNIKDLLIERKVELIIPPFLSGRDKLTPQEEALTKDVAKHRIHVERAIERVKKFRLLQKTISLSLEPIITQIVFIVCCLVNFQEPLVK